MAEFTPNFNLKKPDETDFFNIEDFNGNMDILDEKLKEAIQNEQLQGDVTEIKGTTEEIKTSVGSSGDLSSSPTLFGRLAEIKETLTSKFSEVVSKITGVDEKIGTSGQNNNTTLFGLLNRGMVMSVQSGTIGSEIQLTEVDREFDSTYYKEFTISTVNVNKSLLFVDSETTSDDHRITGKILNNSTIRIYGYNSISGGSIYKLRRTIWHVIEFY